MHEYSIVADIVKAALFSLKNYEVENVETVFLDVGELTFLNPMQLEFCFNVLIENSILSGAKLDITQKKAQIKCNSCGYEGPLEKRPQEDHFRIPVLSCPNCKGEVTLLSGRECTIKSIKMNLKDDSQERDGK
jgi:hydrogenase nickel incorporation protein HypA/HybF